MTAARRSCSTGLATSDDRSVDRTWGEVIILWGRLCSKLILVFETAAIFTKARGRANVKTKVSLLYSRSVAYKFLVNFLLRAHVSLSHMVQTYMYHVPAVRIQRANFYNDARSIRFMVQ